MIFTDSVKVLVFVLSIKEDKKYESCYKSKNVGSIENWRNLLRNSNIHGVTGMLQNGDTVSVTDNFKKFTRDKQGTCYTLME